MTISDHRELVGALLAVDGVADAAVEVGGGADDPGTLRLQLEPGADEVAVAGAVNRLLRSRFGLAVDSDRVRVLEQPAPPVHVARPGRLAIERIQMVSTGLGVVATVTLGLEGRLYDGEAQGAVSASSVHRTVAAATLRAVGSVVADRARFEVEHVELALTGEDRTALVVVTMLTDRGSERLSGASMVREDVRQAVIRATLAAVNRRLEALIDRDGRSGHPARRPSSP